jgi:hypothetical protein
MVHFGQSEIFAAVSCKNRVSGHGHRSLAPAAQS